MYRKLRQRRTVSLLVLAPYLVTMSAARVQIADAVVLNFDDLTHDMKLTGTSYSGLTWEEGSIGVGGVTGYWEALTGSFNYPHSVPTNVVNAGGSTLIGIQFPSAVDMMGSYVAVQGNGNIGWTTGLRVHGYNAGQEVAATDWFTTISTTPAWFDMTALTNVDRIVFESVPVYENTGYYGLDDLTFTYVPEPAGISLGLLALGGLLQRRRRR
jgi:uncharacterized protein (TIGR03382 family)